MIPRWLLNENFPQHSKAVLRAAGWDIVAVGEDNPSVDDEIVMELACCENRWLATFDRDYGELVFRRGLPVPPAIVLLRVPSYRPDAPAEWLLGLQAAGELREGYFHVFDGETVRRRPLLAGVTGGRS